MALHLHHSAGSVTLRPLYVMNVTDVDDKIIQRSKEMAQQRIDGGINDTDAKVDGETIRKDADPIALARHYEHEFWQDMDRLNVLRPDVICRVSEHVEQTIVPYIEQIVNGGMAYVIPEDDDEQIGSVYFDVRAFESKAKGLTKYGKLAPDMASSDFFTWEETNSEGDDDTDNHSLHRKKRDPRDFCLWKHRSPTIEPESVSYSSPWGPGRPGWHVECSAMIHRLSLDFQSTHQFSLHAGGVDLQFPHHCNEIAQAEAHGIAGKDWKEGDEWKEWIPHWVHTGHLYVRGRKMSKSLKNFVTIKEMLRSSRRDNNLDAAAIRQDDEWSSPADDFRLWCLGLSGSYRGPATYSKDRMEEARAIRQKWVRFLIEGQRCLDRWHAASDADYSKSSRFWQMRDLELFEIVRQGSIRCRNALVGLSLGDEEKGSFDMDGATFVKEVTRIADQGMKYVERTKADPRLCTEPLKFTLESLRELLTLVGFTNNTCNAARTDASAQVRVASMQSARDPAMIDEIVAFRAAVRSSAISGIRNKNGLSSAKEVLRLCDELRDDIMPSFGVEILDSKSSSGVDAGGWRSSPRDQSGKKS